MFGRKIKKSECSAFSDENVIAALDKSLAVDAWDTWANYAGGAATDPFVANGPYRILRGGGYSTSSHFCRSAYRIGEDPTFVYDVFGFRVVLAPIVP